MIVLSEPAPMRLTLLVMSRSPLLVSSDPVGASVRWKVPAGSPIGSGAESAFAVMRAERSETNPETSAAEPLAGFTAIESAVVVTKNVAGAVRSSRASSWSWRRRDRGILRHEARWRLGLADRGRSNDVIARLLRYRARSKRS